MIGDPRSNENGMIHDTPVYAVRQSPQTCYPPTRWNANGYPDGGAILLRT
jgi:hypothetical protein